MKIQEPETNNLAREMQNVYKILVIKPEGGPLHAQGGNNIKMDPKEIKCV
jgi:hypothetical protein